MKKRPRIRSFTAISIRTGTFVFALWLLGMAGLTYGTAQYIFDDLKDAGCDFAEYTGRVGRLEYLYSGEAYALEQRNQPGAVGYGIMTAIADSGISAGTPAFEGYYPDEKSIWSIYRNAYADCRTAILFLDPQGNLMHQSGDFVYFHFITEEVWNTCGEENGVNGYGWIDLSDETDPRYSFLRVKYAGVRNLYDFRALRLTGYFDGSRFEPYAFAILDDDAYYDALEIASPTPDEDDLHSIAEEVHEPGLPNTTSDSGSAERPTYSLSELDRMGLIAWDQRYDNTAQMPAGQELVTIYALSPEMEVYDRGGSIRYRDKKYDSLLSLLTSMEYNPDRGSMPLYTEASQFSLWNLIVFSQHSYRNISQDDVASGASWPEPGFTIMTAMQANPLQISMSFLRNVYFATGAFAIIGFLLLRQTIKKNLTDPVEEINQSISSGWIHLAALRKRPLRWREAHELREHYVQTQSQLRMQKNEIIRLSTALEYARTAEQNRRQMTSNLAHELKTPLAVIHSYAEGLKEHIAENKRDQYLDVILAETERTDNMVLEMLDLSRLEAGKVKLSRDDFSLAALTRSVFDVLELAAQAKDLHITFQCPEPCMITADENRIGQVIRNFAANAIQYTSAGGHILVKIQNGRSGVTFTVENESAPLSSEARKKVWDTFYRTEESRSSRGTGLGLAIAKNIIELHGGTCFVRNTKTGVLFGFTLSC